MTQQLKAHGIDMKKAMRGKAKAKAKPTVTITMTADEILAKALALRCCTEATGKGRRWADTELAKDLQRRYRMAYRREWIRKIRSKTS
jgi:hypothetical protein